MNKMKIIIIHGPNLNMLGKREPEVYGNTSISDLNKIIGDEARKLKLDVNYFQSNSEGEIVTEIQNQMSKSDGMIINPAAYTHTSVAIRDAILSANIPTVEVHISNIYKREEFRHKSYISGVSLGVISGFGTYGYILGLYALMNHINSK